VEKDMKEDEDGERREKRGHQVLSTTSSKSKSDTNENNNDKDTEERHFL
jgi:hypothetical protein